MGLPRSMTPLAARNTAIPPICDDLEPPVPPPKRTSRVSPWIKRMRLMLTPSLS